MARGCGVEHVEHDGQAFAVSAADGVHRFDRVICALPPWRTAEALAPLPQLRDVRTVIGKLQHEPIYSVYLQYPANARLPQPMLGFDGGCSQWAFDRGALTGQRGLIGIVISAKGRHQALDHDALAAAAQRELSEAFPQLGVPLWAKVIAEKRATFACEVGVQRPDQRSALPGLFLAGDYTASPYPGTLEAAVRSGVRCARLALGGEGT